MIGAHSLRSRMLLATPYQTIELSNIDVLPYYKDKKARTVAPIQYSKHGLSLQGFTILSPPLTVISYDPSMNRLQLSVANNKTFANKFIAVQEYLANTNLSVSFQRLCSNSVLTLYLFPNTPIQDGTTVADVKPGDTVRCVIRLHNLLLIEIKGQNTLRLQHSVPVLYRV